MDYVEKQSLNMLKKKGTFNLINCSFCINFPKEY